VSSLVEKQVGKYRYYYIVQSGRVNGKPRIVSQRYLGNLDRISAGIDALERGEAVQADESLIMSFGAEVALLDLAERLKIRDIIDKHAGKRQQGLSCGTSMLLAAINRAVCPTSKNLFFGKWFSKTVLPKFFPEANSKNLSSQGFWNIMKLLDKDKIQAIEDDLTKKVIDSYDISTDCLLFDNSNFITYIDTDTPSNLAQRGKSKEHRSDLRIVGLSLMVSPTHNIPLFHELYPGNTNDAKRFSEIIDSLKTRYKKLGRSGEITIVFDRGNNSKDNIEQLLKDDPLRFHFVGGLKRNQCEELFDIPKSQYASLNDERFGGNHSL
jgi:transposase